jgi:hypothetical protein
MSCPGNPAAAGFFMAIRTLPIATVNRKKQQKIKCAIPRYLRKIPPAGKRQNIGSN